MNAILNSIVGDATFLSRAVKSLATAALALAATFITGSSLAAVTPTAVFTDFTGADTDAGITIGGYTLKANGNTVAADGITISTSSGVTVEPTSGNANVTVIVKYSGFSSSAITDNAALISARVSSGKSDNCGMAVKANDSNKAYTYIGTDFRSTSTISGAANPVVPTAGRIALSYSAGGGTGIYVGEDGGTLAGGFDSAFKWGDSTLDNISIGACRNSTWPATGMKIEKIAVVAGASYLNAAGLAEIEAFDWNFPTRMFSDKLPGSDVIVNPGTYGDIVVSGYGYKATAFSQQTTINATTGSPSGLFAHPSWGYIQPHTVGMWVKVDELPASGEKDIYGFSSDGDTNNGYKLAVTAEGKLKIGKKNPNGGWNGGNYYTTSHQITPGEWFYLTVSFGRDISITGSSSPVSIRIYVNGSQVFAQDNGFSADLGGNNFSAFYVGAGVSAAGLYGDRAVISDPATIKNWATNENLVEAAPPMCTKTISAPTDWANIVWEGTESADAQYVVTFESGASLNINENIECKSIVLKGAVAVSAGDFTFPVIDASGATSLAVNGGTIEFSAIPSSNITIADGATLKFDVSSAKTINGISGAGKFVKTGNATLTLNNGANGYAIDGTTIEFATGTVHLNCGSNDAQANNATFVIGENASLTQYGWYNLHGTTTFDYSGSNAKNLLGQNVRTYDDSTLVKKGTGAITLNSGLGEGNGFNTIAVENGTLGFGNANLIKSGATFDFSKLAKTATPIAGDFTFSDAYTFKFPADWAAGETFQLCSGTLSGIPEGGKIEDYSFYLGGEQVTHTLNLSSSGSVFYNTGVKQLTPEGDYAISTLNGETIADGQTVELSMPAGATLTIDAVAKTATSVICNGILLIEGADGAEPTAAQLAALNFEGVTGKVVKKWLATMGVININLVSGRGKFADGDTSDDGMLAGNTPKSSWINVANATGSTTEITEWKTLTQESAAVSGMTFAWDANTVWSADQDTPILNGYLDDGKADGVTLTLTGVPYAMYDVIVYLNTDNGSVYPPITVNGVKYTWDAANGKTVVGADNWGSALRSGVQYGQNALRISDLEGNVTIHTAKGAVPMRACVPAIQIVEVPAKQYRRTYEAAAGEDVKTSDLNAYVAGGDTYAGPFTLTLNGGKFIADADFVCSALAINTATDLTIEKDSDYTISDAEIAKIAINEFGGSKITYVNLATIPATAPASDKTYRWEGNQTLSAIPYVGSAYSGVLDIACGVAGSEGSSVYVTGNKSMTFSTGASYETPSLVLGNQSGVTQNFTQNGGALEFTKTGDGGTSTSSAFVLAHWGSTVTYNLVGGTITVPDDNTVLGWDGKALLTIGGEATTALLKTKGIANNSGHNGNDNVLTISPNGTLSLGAYGAGLQSRTQVKLNGGTLEAYETCTFAAANANGIQVAADSTINVADGKVLTITAPITGAGNITKTGAGTLKLAGSLANYTGKITDSTGAAIDLTAMTVPFDAHVLNRINGEVKINATKTGAWYPIVSNFSGTIEALDIIGTDGVKLEPLCVKDGTLCFGTDGEATYAFTEADKMAMSNMTAGAIFRVPVLSVNMTEATGVAEGYFAWVEDGKYVCAAKKSNSISLKTGTRTKDRDSAIRATDEAVGGFPIAGKFWNNTKVWNENNTATTEYLTLKDGNGVDTEVAVAYRAPNTYYALKSPGTPTSGNQRLTATYLDDGDTAGSEQWTVDKGDGTSITLPAAPNKRGWQFQVSNIPYDMYDLYVYIASDQVDNKDDAAKHLYACPVVISCDGVDWTYYAGPAKAEDSSQWEAYGWAHEGEVVEGKNYIRFRISKNSTGLDDISTINITHGTRNTGANKRLGLAGIQIVEIDDDGVRDRVALAGGEQKWHDAAAWKKTNKEGVASNVDWVDATENPITARVNADVVPALIMDGDALATKLEVTGGTAEAPVEFTLSGSGTLTTETIDATKLHGTLNFEAPVKGTISLAADSYLVVPVSGTIDSLDDIMPDGLSITSGKLKLRGDATFTALTNDFSRIPVSVIDITETSCNVPMIIGANQTVVVDGSKWTSEAIFAATTSRITFKGNYSAVPGTFSGAQGIVNFAGEFTSAEDLTDSGLNYNLEFSGSLAAPNMTFTNFKQFTTLQGCKINVTANLTLFASDGNRHVYLTYGQTTVGETLRMYGGNGQYARFHFGNGGDDPTACIVSAKTIDSNSFGTLVDTYDMNRGLTVNLGSGGWALSGHTSYPDTAKMQLNGIKIVATDDTTLNPNKFNVTADSTLEVPAAKTMTLRKVLAGAAKVVKTGEGTLVLAAGEGSAVQVDAGMLKLAAGDEANVTVGENGGLTLTVTEEQWINGYTSTATIPDGKDITFLDPEGNVIAGTTGKVLPVKPGVATWKGTTNNDWNTGSNWEPVGVPDADSIVKINATEADVEIALNNGVTITSLMVDGANDVILSGKALTVTGDFVKRGTGTLAMTLAADSALPMSIEGTVALEVPAEASYTLSGVISGAGKLVKTGEGTLTLGADNTFTGGTVIEAGSLVFGGYSGDVSKGPLGPYVNDAGNWNANVVVKNGATLDVNGKQDMTYVVELEEGAIFKNGSATDISANNRQTKMVRLSGNATVDANGAFGIHNGGHAETKLDLGSYTLTKTGTGAFELVKTTISGDGMLDVTAGKLLVNNGAVTGADATIKIGADASLELNQSLTVKNLEMNGSRTGSGDLMVNGILSGTGSVGAVTLGEDASLDVTKGPITISTLFSFADNLVIKCPLKNCKLIKGLSLDPSATVKLVDPNGVDIPANKGTLSFKNGTLAFSLNGFMLMLK